MFCLFKIYSWPSSSFLLILLTILAALLSFGNASVTTIFIFGDSTVDPGNNNYIKTIFKSDFPPYGYDFVNKTPTGRFTDGLLVTDFIASYAGVKQTVPAYLDPKLSLDDLITGVSFASAGSGYDPATPAKNGVLSLSKQLEYFDEYKQKVEEMIGKQRTEEIVENAVYVISAGTNDFVFTLGLLEYHLMVLTAPTYMQFLLDQCKSFVQDLMQRGPRKIAVVSVAPVGCLPVVITFHAQDQLFLHEEQPQKSSSRSCVDSLSKVTTDFNQMLEAEIKMMQDSHPNDLLAYADIYGPLYDQIKNPHKYGFEVVDRGCCGSGTLEGGYLCHSESQICKDLSKHMFWDAIHPTQRSYKFLFEALRPIVDEFIQYSN